MSKKRESISMSSLDALLRRAELGVLYNSAADSETSRKLFKFWQGYAKALKDFGNGVGEILAEKDAKLNGKAQQSDRITEKHITLLHANRLELEGDIQAAAKLRQLHQVEMSYDEWLVKTEWVQYTAKYYELGMHRADVIKQRIDSLDEENHDLRHAVKLALEYWARRQQRYKNRSPVWVNKARAALDKSHSIKGSTVMPLRKP